MASQSARIGGYVGHNDLRTQRVQNQNMVCPNFQTREGMDHLPYMNVTYHFEQAVTITKTHTVTIQTKATKK